MPDTSIAKILIVDDEAPQTEALCNTLRDEGYFTVGFKSAREALAALHGQRFDLLLTDLMMPEMDGIALLRSALGTDADLVCIMMTGHGTIGTAVQAMKAGALDYILKPFDLTVILPVLSRALAMRRLRLENAALERGLRERTSELEAANKELDAFAHSVSHDLRAPLRAIGGFSEILLERSAEMPEQDQRLLKRVCDGAKTMGDLIEGLLNLSYLGRQPLSKRTLNVREIVWQALDGLHKEREGRQVEIRVGDLPDCVADPTLFKQIYVNLLSNAFKYTRQKEKAIVEVGCQRQDGENIYFVRDNGAGFDMQYSKKLFGVFQRLHRVDEFEGIGVGLSIVQRIIRRHGGRIWAEAEADNGAVFYFYLPKQDATTAS